MMSNFENGTYTKIDQVEVSLPPSDESNSANHSTEHLLPEYSEQPSARTIERDLLKFYPGYNGKIPYMPQAKPYQSTFKLVLLVLVSVITTLSMLTLIGPVSILYMYCCPHPMLRMMKGFCHYWLHFFISLMMFFLGIKLVVTGHKGRFKARSLIIMNHLSHFDWFWFLVYVMRAGRIIDLVVVLKHEIKFVPILGWAAQTMGFIFIRRNWEDDHEYMRRYITIYNEYDDNFFLLIFPEGADYNPGHLRKSIQFAAKNNLHQLYYTLQPRLRGFKLVVEMMRKRGISAVYDITMGFPKDISKTELDFFKGHVPQEVHCHVNYFDASEMPLDEEELGAWCQERWRIKDDRLGSFVNDGYFREDPSDPHEQLNGATPIRTKAETNMLYLKGNVFTIVLTTASFIIFFYCNTLWHSVFWSVFFMSLNYLPTNGVDGYFHWCHRKLIKNSKYK